MFDILLSLSLRHGVLNVVATYSVPSATANGIESAALDQSLHISSSDHSREITVCLYDANDLDGFDERSVAIIESE